MSTNTNQTSFYHPTSSILFVGICSLNKATISLDEPYVINQSIAARLKDSKAVKLLFLARNDSLDLIFNQGLENKGTLLAEHPLNKDLRQGPDFKGKAKARYLPAIDRYTGRFYAGKGNDGKNYELKSSLLKSSHHLLIISGLYGLVLPEEQIQLYESPLEDLQPVQDVWKKDDRLTKILAAYIKAEEIRLVVDMTGQRAYQELIEWPAIEALKDVRVLHAMAKIGAGEDQIKSFAAALCDPLLRMSSSDLLNLPDSWMLDSHHVMLRKTITPPKGDNWPKEPTPVDKFASDLSNLIDRSLVTDERPLAVLFEHDNAKELLREIERKKTEWQLYVHPNVQKDINSYDNPHIKRLMYEKLHQLLLTYPIPRNWKEITEIYKKIKEFRFWRLRINDYRLQFCTDEGSRKLFLFRFEKRQETDQTYDYSNFDIATLRRMTIRDE